MPEAVIVHSNVTLACQYDLEKVSMKRFLMSFFLILYLLVTLLMTSQKLTVDGGQI